MEKDFKDFDDLFREEASAYTELPSPAVWQALEKRLDKDKKRRVFPLRWYWYFSLLSFVTLLAAYAFRDRVRVSQNVVMSVPAAPQAAVAVTSSTSEDETTPAPTTQEEAIAGNEAEEPKQNNNEEVEEPQRTSSNSEYAATKKHQDNSAKSESANAPAVGTSIYSYDEFEEHNTQSVAAMPETEANEPAAGNEYVANKVRKHNMVVVEMAPAAVSSSKQRSVAMTENSDEPAIQAYSNNVGNEKKLHVKKTARGKNKNHKNAVAATISNHKKHVQQQQAAVAATGKQQSVTEMPVAAKTMDVAKAERKQEIQLSNKKDATGDAQVKATDAKVLAANSVSTVVAVKENRTAATTKTTERSIVAQKATTNMPAKGAAQTKVAEKNTAVAVSATVASKEQVKSAATKENTTTKQHAAVAIEEERTKKDAKAKSDETVAALAAATRQHPEVTVKATTTNIVTGSAKLAQQSVAVVTKKGAAKKGTETIAGTMPETKPTDSKVANDVVKVSEVKTQVNPAANAGVAAKQAATPAGQKQKKQALKPASSVPAIAARNQKNAMPAKAASSLSLPAAADEPEDIAATVSVLAAAVPKEMPKRIAAATVAKVEDSVSVPADTAKQDMSDLMKLVIGIKGGFEKGTGTYGSNKLVVAPYLQYRIGNKLSLMVQPSLKAANAAKHMVGNAANYYTIKPGTENYQFQDSQLVYLVLTGDSLWRRNYNTSQKYDSIVKTNSIGGTYVEVELPLLLQYSISPRLSVYGGLNTVYSKRLSVKEDTRTMENLTASGSTYTLAPLHAPAPLPTSTGIAYTGSPLSTYTGPAYPQQNSGLVRMGYMLGVSYELKKRWMADVMVQQCFTTKNMQGSYNVNSALSMPYVRLTLGYRLSK